MNLTEDRDDKTGYFMRVIAIKKLQEFGERHTDSRQPLLAWYNEVKKENWDTPNDVKLRYPSASILRGNRVVFNIKGNKYRLVVEVNYSKQVVYVKFVGSHQQYNNIDSRRI